MNKLEKNLLSIYKSILKNWNVIFSVIAVLGVLISQFIPDLQNYQNFFIFIGLNAIVWTLVEIKVKLLEKEKNIKYENMREARPHILKTIKNSMNVSKNKHLTIKIVGGRIRTISDMIRELKTDIEKQKNITFIIYCIDPEFVISWGLSESNISQERQEKNKISAAQITQAYQEINSYNNLEIFKKNNLKLEVKFYKEPPFVYCYLIGDKELYWGHYTWNSRYEDFEGPINPCYYLQNVDSEFSSIYEWLNSRLSFHDLSGGNTI